MLITVCISIHANAQYNPDSLRTVWNDETRSDSLRVVACHHLIWKVYMYSNPDSTILLGADLYNFGVETDNLRAQSVGIRAMGSAYDIQGKYVEALAYYRQAKDIYDKRGFVSGQVSMLSHIGAIYKKMSDESRALEYFMKALAIAEKESLKPHMASIFSSIGDMYYRQGDNEKALQYYKQNLELREDQGDEMKIGNALHNIGNIHMQAGDTAKALDHYDRALELHRVVNNLRGIGAVNAAKGYLLYEQNDPKALDFCTKAYEAHEQLGDPSGMATCLTYLGYIYLYTDQKDYKKAIEFSNQAYEIGRNIGVLEIQEDACGNLYEAHKRNGDGNKALEYLELVTTLQDSMNSEETSMKLQQMEFAKQVLADSLATVEEARLIEEAHKEEVRQKNRTRNIFGGVGFFALILAGGFFWRWRYVQQSKATLQVEKDRSENLLLNILPADIAAELKAKGKADARDFEMVSILFTDFKGFTAASEKLSAQDLVSEINTCFEAFDGIMGKYNIEKIKTIGDAYMAAGGLPVPTDDSVKNTVLAALEMQVFIRDRKAKLDDEGKPGFEMRVGVHTGPVVAGIVGVKKFQYDIWGDTVNTASRMESSGEVGKVNISEATYELLKDDAQFNFESRGKVEAKGKGELEMYFIEKGSA